MGILQFFKQEKKKEMEEIPFSQFTPWLQAHVERISQEHKSVITAYVQQWPEQEKVLDQLRLEMQKKLELLPSQKETQRKHLQALLSELRVLKEMLLSFQQTAELERILKLHSLLGGKLTLLREQEIEELALLNEWYTLQQQFETKMREIHLLPLWKLKENDVSLQESIVLVASCQRQLQLKEDRRRMILVKKEEKESEMEELKKDTAYASIRTWKRKQDVIQEQSAEIENEVRAFFSKLNPLLEGYTLQENNAETLSLLQRYNQETGPTFQHDEHLAIISVLQYLKTLLLGEKLFSADMKQRGMFLKHVEKGINSLPPLQKEFLVLQQQLVEIEHSLAVTSLLLKVQDVQYRLDHFTRQALSLDEEIQSIKLELTKLEKRKAAEKKKIEQTIQSALGKEVVLV